MPHDPDDPICAALPTKVRALTLVFCEAHQAYTLHVSVIRQASEDLDVDLSSDVHFGPFDSFYEVEQGCREALDLLLRS